MSYAFLSTEQGDIGLRYRLAELPHMALLFRSPAGQHMCRPISRLVHASRSLQLMDSTSRSALCKPEDVVS